MDFSYDIYTHTHTDHHREVVQEMFGVLDKKGFFYEGTQSMPYSLTEQRFLSDRFVEGTCPHCGFESARGDQCGVRNLSMHRRLAVDMFRRIQDLCSRLPHIPGSFVLTQNEGSCVNVRPYQNPLTAVPCRDIDRSAQSSVLATTKS